MPKKERGMFFNHFSVRVIGGSEENDGYVAMRHKDTYKLSLRNDRDIPCDAVVLIDGTEVGTWRVPARQSITLEHPANDQGNFTFLLPDTPDGQAAGLVKNNDLGLISVTFKPGYEDTARPLRKHYSTTWSSTGTVNHGNNVYYTNTIWNGLSNTGQINNCCSLTSYEQGGTGLTGYSGQYYGYANNINYNGENVTINLRLVSKGNAVVNNLASTPIPPPVR